jgi:hypothetical protein
MASKDHPYSEAIRTLTSLAQLDMDAVLAYEQAIRGIDEGDRQIKEALEGFQDDHIRHIDDLSAQIEALGETPPPFKRDVKGFFIEGMTAIMSKIGTRSALIAMTENEALTNAMYHRALKTKGLPSMAKAVIQKNARDEERHIAYITTALKSKFGVTAATPRMDDADAAMVPT